MLVSGHYSSSSLCHIHGEQSHGLLTVNLKCWWPQLLGVQVTWRLRACLQWSGTCWAARDTGCYDCDCVVHPIPLDSESGMESKHFHPDPWVRSMLLCLQRYRVSGWSFIPKGQRTWSLFWVYPSCCSWTPDFSLLSFSVYELCSSGKKRTFSGGT